MAHIIPTIDYQKMAYAKKYYAERGFLYCEVPWVVSFESYVATRPADRRDFYTLDGYLVASAEQGFIELMQSNELGARHSAITPCFRDEPVLDDIHYKYFLKLELIDRDARVESLHAMIDIAKNFFEHFLPVEVVPTGKDSFDICDQEHHIELGSYGIRQWKGFAWTYGTGLALPRLDVVLSKNKNKL